ncbi:hypothetical protein BHE74_00029101 [Ensete ventricosum]|nr:hypothetical protein BHE74_00029101 [Ensete ventricosum]
MFRRGRKRRGRHGEDEEEKETVEEEEAKGRKLKEEKRCTHRQLCMMEVYSVGSCTRRAECDPRSGSRLEWYIPYVYLPVDRHVDCPLPGSMKYLAAARRGEARRGRREHSKKREKHQRRGRSIEKEDHEVTDAPSPTSR